MVRNYALGLMSLVVISSQSYAGVYTPVDSTYKLTFDEEFNGTSVDTSKWGTNWLGSAGQITKPINSAELAAYDPKQTSVSGGYLRFDAIKKTVTATDGRSYSYVSGIVQSHRKFEQAFGYIEARIFVPGSGGKIYNWPAVWMNGDHSRYGRSWPYAGEMDIMESLGDGEACYHFHSDATHEGKCASGAYRLAYLRRTLGAWKSDLSLRRQGHRHDDVGNYLFADVSHSQSWN